MEYIVEKDQKVKTLSQEDKLGIAKKIVDDFETYDKGRAAQLEKSQKLIDEIYFKNVAKQREDGKTSKDKDWKCVIKTCKVFMYSQILKAFIWKNIYANTNSMFDVSGESTESDNNSNKQKTVLVDCLEKMEYSKTCDKIIDNSLLYGELISFVTWRKESAEYRRPIDVITAIKEPATFPKLAKAIAKGDKYFVDEKVVYDNPYIYDVDPENFVFDTTQERNWDTCPKIYRTWRTPYDIINNKYFEVSKEIADSLRDMVKQESDLSDLADQGKSSLKDEAVNGTTVEVLEHWGDLTLKDGTLLRNWYAVVVGRKYLVCFEKNPYVINPFTYGAYIQDPETKRGISPLYSIVDLANLQEDKIRRTLNLQALVENPPVFSAKGFFGEDPDDIELYPGKIIEYDPQLYNDAPVKPWEVNPAAFSEDLKYFDDIMCEISGIFPNMAGATENDRTTATEISTKVEGQLTRLKMLLDVINQYLILSDVKKLAELKANFTFGQETVFTDKDNKPEDVVIDDEVRQAEYRYTYSDRSATSERFNYADMVAQAVQMFAKSGLPININEFFVWYMEQKGVENPERFLQDQTLLDPMVQQALMNDPTLAPIIQQMQAQVEQLKATQKVPENDSEIPEIEPMAQPEEMSNPSSGLQGRNLMNG